MFPIYLKKLGDMPYRSNFKENAYQRYRNLKLESNRWRIDNTEARDVKDFFQSPPSARSTSVSPRWVKSRCFSTLMPNNT
jgi:hypothetical protein